MLKYTLKVLIPLTIVFLVSCTPKGISPVPKDIMADLDEVRSLTRTELADNQKIQNDYESLYQNISEMSLNTDDEFIIVLIDQPTKIRLGRNNIWTKLLVLKEFEIAIQGKKSLTDYAYLDMRYSNQVIAKERL